VPVSRDRDLARLLAAVLDGVEPAVGEAGALASVLEQAAESARFEMPAVEVEEALGRARRRVQPGIRRPIIRVGIVLAGVAAAAAAAVVIVVVAPFSRAPGLDVTARASEALGGAGTVLEVTELVRPAEEGTFEESTRVGWLDVDKGRARWTQRVGGRRMSETLLEPRSLRHYLPQQNAVIAARSCAAFASGCADLVDPVAFYRDALAAADGAEVTETVVDGKRAYRIVLPVQSLPDTSRIEQVAFVDAETYLPLRLVWRDVPDRGPPRPFATIDVVSVRLVPREEAPADAFTLRLPEDVEVVERTEAGAIVETRVLGLDQGRRIEPALLWLGAEYDGVPLESIEEVVLEEGRAYRLQYGELTVWNYTTTVPADILARLLGPTKVVPLENGSIVRFYEDSSGRAVGELESANRSAAIVAPDLEKGEVFDALNRLAPLR
jgi:hypothetical protein